MIFHDLSFYFAFVYLFLGISWEYFKVKYIFWAIWPSDANLRICPEVCQAMCPDLTYAPARAGSWEIHFTGFTWETERKGGPKQANPKSTTGPKWRVWISLEDSLPTSWLWLKRDKSIIDQIRDIPQQHEPLAAPVLTASLQAITERRATGVVKAVNASGGYGFISCPDIASFGFMADHQILPLCPLMRSMLHAPRCWN